MPRFLQTDVLPDSLDEILELDKLEYQDCSIPLTAEELEDKHRKIKIDILSVLTPYKDPVPASFIFRDMDEIGEPLNPRQHGFKTLHAMMMAFSDKVVCHEQEDSRYKYSARTSERSSHIQKLVAEQLRPGEKERDRRSRSLGRRRRDAMFTTYGTSFRFRSLAPPPDSMFTSAVFDDGRTKQEREAANLNAWGASLSGGPGGGGGAPISWQSVLARGPPQSPSAVKKEEISLSSSSSSSCSSSDDEDEEMERRRKSEGVKARLPSLSSVVVGFPSRIGRLADVRFEDTDAQPSSSRAELFNGEVCERVKTIVLQCGTMRTNGEVALRVCAVGDKYRQLHDGQLGGISSNEEDALATAMQPVSTELWRVECDREGGSVEYYVVVKNGEERTEGTRAATHVPLFAAGQHRRSLITTPGQRSLMFTMKSVSGHNARYEKEEEKRKERLENHLHDALGIVPREDTSTEQPESGEGKMTLLTAQRPIWTGVEGGRQAEMIQKRTEVEEGGGRGDGTMAREEILQLESAAGSLSDELTTRLGRHKLLRSQFDDVEHRALEMRKDLNRQLLADKQRQNAPQLQQQYQPPPQPSQQRGPPEQPKAEMSGFGGINWGTQAKTIPPTATTVSKPPPPPATVNSPPNNHTARPASPAELPPVKPFGEAIVAAAATMGSLRHSSSSTEDDIIKPSRSTLASKVGISGLSNIAAYSAQPQPKPTSGFPSAFGGQPQQPQHREESFGGGAKMAAARAERDETVRQPPVQPVQQDDLKELQLNHTALQRCRFRIAAKSLLEDLKKGKRVTFKDLEKHGLAEFLFTNPAIFNFLENDDEGEVMLVNFDATEADFKFPAEGPTSPTQQTVPQPQPLPRQSASPAEKQQSVQMNVAKAEPEDTKRMWNDTVPLHRDIQSLTNLSNFIEPINEKGNMGMCSIMASFLPNRLLIAFHDTPEYFLGRLHDLSNKIALAFQLSQPSPMTKRTRGQFAIAANEDHTLMCRVVLLGTSTSSEQWECACLDVNAVLHVKLDQLFPMPEAFSLENFQSCTFIATLKSIKELNAAAVDYIHAQMEMDPAVEQKKDLAVTIQPGPGGDYLYVDALAVDRVGSAQPVAHWMSEHMVRMFRLNSNLYDPPNPNVSDAIRHVQECACDNYDATAEGVKLLKESAANVGEVKTTKAGIETPVCDPLTPPHDSVSGHFPVTTPVVKAAGDNVVKPASGMVLLDTNVLLSAIELASQGDGGDAAWTKLWKKMLISTAKQMAQLNLDLLHHKGLSDHDARRMLLSLAAIED